MEVIIASEAWPLSPRVELEVQTLRSDHEVKVLSWNRNGETKETSVSLFNKKCSNKIDVITRLPFFLAWVLKKIFKEKPDVIHCTHLVILPVAIVCKYIIGVKIVYDTYERYGLLWSEHFNSREKYISETVDNSEARLTSLCDSVLTTDSKNNVLKKRFKKYCKNVQVIYNVPEIDENNKKVRITNESIAKKIKNRFTIACVGGISKRKGIINLLKAFDAVQLCSNINILLIGTFKDEESERYVENRSSKNCIHIDWLQYEVMMEYLRYADVGVVPYPPEPRYKLNSAGTSRKFFTYMQAGIPIVGPQEWEIGEIVRIVGNGLLVDTTSPIEIASALLHLKRNNSKISKMSMRGRRALENKYNWKKERKKLIRAYNLL